MNQREKGLSTIAIILIVVIVAGASIGATAYVLTRPQPNFQVRELSVSPEIVAEGETVTAQVRVANVGHGRGTHMVKLEIENETLKKKVTLEAGESRTVDFDIEKQEWGTYSLSIGDLSETFKVAEPARFELSNLQVSPKETEPGETVTITLNVKNVGGIEGSYTVNMKINGELENKKEVTLAPNETTQVTFNETKSISNDYSVNIGNLSGSFEVKQVAKLPTLHMDDTWSIRVSGENVYEFNYEVIGKETLNGQPCYVVDFSIEPPYRGLVEEAKGWISRKTLLPLRIKMGAFTYTYSYRFLGENKWPLWVGKEHKIVETERNPEGKKKTNTYIFSVRERENITVPAGTFSAFRIEKRTGNGVLVSTRWYSDKAKMNVKTIDHKTGEVQELLTSSIGEVKAKGAKFEVSDLEISPKKPQSEEPVTITLSVTNVGDVWGTHKLNLKIDDKVEKTKYVSLETGESASVLFKAKRSRPKTYSVKVDGVSGSFEVKPKLTGVEVSEPADHNLRTSVKVSIEGKKDSYTLSMSGPEETEVGSAYVTETQMADGVQAVWVPLAESEVSAKAGTYRLVITDGLGNKVHEEEFGPYSGADLQVVRSGSPVTSYDQFLGFKIESIDLKVKNEGDLPAYISEVEVSIDGKEGSCSISGEREVISAGEIDTLTLSNLFIGRLDSGTYTATFKLKEGVFGQTRTVTAHSTTFEVEKEAVLWSKTFGGSGNDKYSSMIQADDGGYLVAGTTESFGSGGSDIYVVKVDSSGNVKWSKTYGGSKDEEISRHRSLVKAQDGGFILVGTTNSFGADGDIYLLKIDSSGDKEWSKTYGPGDDKGHSIVQTLDGGYAVLGSTNIGNEDVYLLKTDSSGDVEWSKTYGGDGRDKGWFLIQTTDGGFAMVSPTTSYGAGGWDSWFIKTDSSGNMEWNKTYGGPTYEAPNGLVQTTDGYAIAGSESLEPDLFLLKMDSKGNREWKKTYGGSEKERCFSLIRTENGGFAMTGFTESFGSGGKDVYMVKTDSSGRSTGARTFGGSDDDVGNSMLQTQDGNFLIAGLTKSFGEGREDGWLLKVKGE